MVRFMVKIYIFTLLIMSSNLSYSKEVFNFLGKWCSHYNTTGVCVSVENLKKDGTYYSHGINKSANVRYETMGTWYIENDKACFSPTERKYYNNETGKELSFDYKLEKYCDRVLEVKENQFTIEEHTNKTKVVIYKMLD